VLQFRREPYARASTRSFWLAPGLALLFVVVPSAALAASTISVTATGDAGTADTCTLRQAIVAMNTQSTLGTLCVSTPSQDDTILFSVATFPQGGANVILLADAIDSTLEVTHATLTIDASANERVTIERPAAAVNAYSLLSAQSPGGALTLRNLTFRNGAEGGCALSGGGGGGGVCAVERTLTIVNCTFEGNSATRAGGGVYIFDGILAVSDSTFNGNSAIFGGGGIRSNRSDTTVTRSTFSGNSAPGQFGQGVGSGGGIDSLYGTLVVFDSTFIGNSAKYGGALFGLYSNSVTNTTFSGNSAEVLGGAIVLREGTLVNSTVVGNTVGSEDGGGGIYGDEASITLTNTIVAVNSGDDIEPAGLFDGTGNLIGGDPMLGAPADNGGPTLTMLPELESPAADAVDCTAAPATDQRGIPRPQGFRCDIGAVDITGVTVFRNGFENATP
jgi:predicted outer membrane repeat protein